MSNSSEERIAQLLEESNAEAVDVAEQLAEEMGGTPFQVEFASALQRIRRYDFSAALEQIGLLLAKWQIPTP